MNRLKIFLCILITIGSMIFLTACSGIKISLENDNSTIDITTNNSQYNNTKDAGNESKESLESEKENDTEEESSIEENDSVWNTDNNATEIIEDQDTAASGDIEASEVEEEPEYVWVYIETKAFSWDITNDYYDYIAEGAGETTFHNCVAYTGPTDTYPDPDKDNGEYFEMTVTYSEPPNMFKPEETVSLSIKTISGGTADYFSFWFNTGAQFDDAGVEWGSGTAANRPFKDSNEVSSFMSKVGNINDYEGTISAIAPKGEQGDQIALLMGLSGQCKVGTAFIYELQEIE